MRIIGHLDMDAFFASIEERDSPQFSGLPIVVGADPRGGRGRGVVSTANYKAREYGIHSAMPISRAWRAAEEAQKTGKKPAVFLPVNFKHYEEVSARIFAILRRHAKIVEPASIDEAYFDLSAAGSFEYATALCRKIKKEISAKEKITASIGLGSNKLVAKIASDQQKPDGLTIVKGKETEKFLENLLVRKIPGIGPKTEALLAKQNVVSVRDLKKISVDDLTSMFGRVGFDLYNKARGIDDSPLIEEYEAKSIGEQETFLIDTRDSLFLFEHLKSLCRGIWDRFKQSGFKHFRTVAVTVRFSDFETKSHAHTFEKPVDTLSALEFEAMRSLLPFLDRRANPKKKAIRLIGVRIEKLS